MKKIFISCITLLFVLCYPGITKAKTYTTLLDTVNKYSLQYPYNWSVIKTPLSKNLIKAHINKDNNSGIQIRIYKNNKSFNDFLKWYKKDYQTQMLGHHGGSIVLLSEKHSKPNEPKSYNYAINFSNKQNQQWYIKQYLWPRGNQVYLMQCGTEYINKDSFEKSIDAIANSFRFTR